MQRQRPAAARLCVQAPWHSGCAAIGVIAVVCDCILPTFERKEQKEWRDEVLEKQWWWPCLCESSTLRCKPLGNTCLFQAALQHLHAQHAHHRCPMLAAGMPTALNLFVAQFSSLVLSTVLMLSDALPSSVPTGCC